jgi:hypothetical protein
VIGDTDASGGYGVLGLSSQGDGVHGITATSSGSGVAGFNTGTDGGNGAYGVSTTGTGVYGVAAGRSGIGPPTPHAGVVGDTDVTGGIGVIALSKAGTGISAISRDGTGVQTVGTTYGLQAQGTSAQLRLVPASTLGPPTSGSHLIGEILLDKAAALHVCTASGTPGTWVTLTA